MVTAMKLRVPTAQIAEDYSCDWLVNEVNKHLPEEVKVFSCTRVGKSFNAKNTCCEVCS